MRLPIPEYPCCGRAERAKRVRRRDTYRVLKPSSDDSLEAPEYARGSPERMLASAVCVIWRGPDMFSCADVLLFERSIGAAKAQ